MQDVVIVGGGVIGLTIARELAQSGWTISVLDQSPMGTEASWAGAGMLPPGDLTGNASLEALTTLSISLWPELSATLLEETGIDNGYRRCGSLQIRFTEDAPHVPASTVTTTLQPLSHELQTWERLGVECERLDSSGLRHYESALHPEISSGYRLPTMAQIRNPRHLKALATSCANAGVKLLTGQTVVGWKRNAGRITAACTLTDEIQAGHFIITAGAWSSPLLKTLGVHERIRPIRGQIALLNASCLPFKHIIECGSRYLVPRTDGRILIGSTEEDVGYLKENTAQGIQSLMAFATQVVPALKEARFEKAWAGLRPFIERGRPLIGSVDQYDNLLVATGHFRAGLTNSPATAQLIREIMGATTPSIDLNDFRPSQANLADPA